MKTFRCYVGNPELHPFMLVFNVQAQDGQEARRVAAERCLLLTEEHGGASLAGWSAFADAGLYFTDEGATVESVMALIDVTDAETGEEA